MLRTLLLLVIVVLISCNNNNEPVTDTSTTLRGNYCFSNNTNKDTVLLQLVVNDTSITGNLDYMLYEKDRNSGTLQGIIKGDTIFAEYTFRSEGTTSVRQVVFLQQDSVLVEGHGEMMETNGKMVFRNPQNMLFTNGLILKRIDCP